METTVTIISTILNLVFGAGLIASLKAIKTLRSEVVKADAEAKSAEAEAKGKEIDNEEKSNKIIYDFIVEPLKGEISRLRKDVRQLQRAIDKISGCEYSDKCPVKKEINSDDKGLEV